jgi:hypothetical protein
MKSDISNQRQPEGEILTTKQFARKIRKTPHAVRQYVENGMPVYERGGKGVSNQIDLAAAWDWALKGNHGRQPGRPANSVDDTKQRIQNAIAERREFELAKAREGYIDIRDWPPFIDDKMVTMRNEFMKLSAKFREDFTEPPSTNVAVQWLRDEHKRILNQLSTGLKAVPDEAKAGR